MAEPGAWPGRALPISMPMAASITKRSCAGRAAPRIPIQPGLAKKWEFSPDGKELTLYFRKGLKWSDGTPWTVD